MRNTWAAYLVDIETGRIEWTLGGRNSSFKFGPGADFQWQHDVALQARLDGQPVRRPLLPADRRRHLRAGDRALARARAEARRAGDARRRSPPSTASGEGFESRIHGRHAAAGQRQRVRRLGLGTVLLASTAARASCCSKPNFPGSDLTYRATLEQWVGLPLTAPAGAARASRRRDDGVRELERRHPGRLLAGPGRARRRRHERRRDAPPGPASRRRSRSPAGYTSFEVQALDAAGRVIGTSTAF